MGISRYLFNDWFTAAELDAMDRKMELHHLHRQEAVERTRALEERVGRLELDLGRVALLARALAEACVTQGVLPLEVVKQEIERCDVFDGEFDGMLATRYAHPDEVVMEESAEDSTEAAPAEEVDLEKDPTEAEPEWIDGEPAEFHEEDFTPVEGLPEGVEPLDELQPIEDSATEDVDETPAEEEPR